MSNLPCQKGQECPPEHRILDISPPNPCRRPPLRASSPASVSAPARSSRSSPLAAACQASPRSCTPSCRRVPCLAGPSLHQLAFAGPGSLGATLSVCRRPAEQEAVRAARVGPCSCRSRRVALRDPPIEPCSPGPPHHASQFVKFMQESGAAAPRKRARVGAAPDCDPPSQHSRSVARRPLAPCAASQPSACDHDTPRHGQPVTCFKSQRPCRRSSAGAPTVQRGARLRPSHPF